MSSGSPILSGSERNILLKMSSLCREKDLELLLHSKPLIGIYSHDPPRTDLEAREPEQVDY